MPKKGHSERYTFAGQVTSALARFGGRPSDGVHLTDAR